MMVMTCALMEQNAQASDRTVDIYSACANGQIENVRLLLGQGTNVNAVNGDKETPLHIACYFGNLDIVRLLLASGANVDAVNDDKETPLHIACRKNRLDIVRLLLPSGANIDAKNWQDVTPSMIANTRLNILMTLPQTRDTLDKIIRYEQIIEIFRIIKKVQG